ncbi:Pass1-related protein [Minicystis rosea]|nr:Pass1-related protein [Minicystis rosea]
MTALPAIDTRSAYDGAMRALRLSLGRPPARAADIARLHLPSIDRFEREHRRASRPALLEGLTERWPRRPSVDGLRDRFSDRRLPVTMAPGGKVDPNARAGVIYQAMLLGEYVDKLPEPTHPGYYMVVPLESSLPELLADIEAPQYTVGAWWSTTRLWLSAKDTSSPLHRDIADNIIVQLQGRKRILLYPPDHTAWLYSNALTSGLPNFSRFDPEAPDYDRFPHARHAEPLEVTLHPGEALFLPSGWWHQVRAVDISVTINFWWARGKLELMVRLAELVKRARGLEMYGLRGSASKNGHTVK